MHELRIGCSGWSYPHWRATVYGGLPASRWLARYASWFDTVEVNSTFYRLASPAAVASWVAHTPPGFVFALKASRYVTHMKRLREMDAGVARFYEPLGPLLDAGKLGPILWQLPAHFRRDEDRLAAALARLPPGRHAFEFRDPSWLAPDVLALLRAHDVALAIGDHPDRPWQTHELTAGWTYVRFHHGARGRRGNYAERELDDWAVRIGAWRREVDVYAYFNNDWEGFAVANARGLLRRLAR